MIDLKNDKQHSTSESQAYALFFSLVANDRLAFDQILGWTRNNLAEGDLTIRLPAWRWGRKTDGSEWGILDRNSATDADLWLAYTLLEAGRLWRAPAYDQLGRALAALTLSNAAAEIPGLGICLLPGAQGFSHPPDRWRLNPSYLPIQILRLMTYRVASQPWGAVLDSSVRVLRGSSPLGYAPDWITFHKDKGFVADQESGGRGSYDAIRVYLWLGMLAPQEPLRPLLLDHFAPMSRLVSGNLAPPETIDSVTGQTLGIGPIGFSAALIPFLAAYKMLPLARCQRVRIDYINSLNNDTNGVLSYYDQSLVLFGVGWQERRFAFSRDGSLITAWKTLCN